MNYQPKPDRFTHHLFFLLIGVLVCCALYAAPLSAADPDTERIRVLADRLITNDKESYAEFQGNVEANQGDFRIRSNTLRIYYKRGAAKDPAAGDEESIKKVVATGNVRIDADGKKATSDKAEYTPEDGTLVLTGPDSTLISDKNSISGSRITLHRESRQLKVEGNARQRVHAVFYTSRGKRLLGGTKPAPARPEKEIVRAPEPEKDEKVEIVAAPPQPVPEKKPAVEIIETKPAAPPSTAATVPTPAEKPAATPAAAPAPSSMEVASEKISEERLEDGSGAESLEQRASRQPPAEEPAAAKEAGDQPEVDAISPAPSPEAIAGDAPPAATGEEVLAADDEEAAAAALVENAVPTGSLFRVAAIAAIDNKTYYKGPEVETVLFDGVVDIVRSECPDVQLLTPGEPAFPGFLTPLPIHPSGETDNFAIAALGRQSGINAVITAAVTEIALERDVKGMLWMKEARFFLRVAVALEVFDTETATKIIDDSFAYLVDIEDTSYDIVELDKQIPPEMVREAFENLVPQIGEYVAETLNRQQWKAFVTKVTEDGVVVSAGASTGLVSGNVFDVFDVRIIQGAGGHRFIVPGLKTGSIRITETQESSANATLIFGDGIREGSTIKVVE